MQTAVADYLARDDLTTYIPNFIQNAENKLYRSLNLRNEETALSISISSGVAAVPSDFKSLKFAYISASPSVLLEWVPITQLYEEYPTRSGASDAILISREGTNFVFGPFSKDATLAGIYYAKKDPLRTTDPSWYATNAPDVLLYASLLESAPFIKDPEQILIWQGFLSDAVDTLGIEERGSSISEGSIATRPQ